MILSEQRGGVNKRICNHHTRNRNNNNHHLYHHHHVKPEAGSDGGNYLGDQPIEVGVGWPLHSEVVVAQIINSLKKIFKK